MDNKRQATSKRLQVNKANVFMVVVISVASFITVFSLTASKALFSQQQYQAKVIEQKQAARATLKSNLDARTDLVNQYEAFALTSVNIMGGYIDGQNDKDGDNPQLVLDSLPSKYDYPALITSLEKVLSSTEGATIKGIAGNDDALLQNDTGLSKPVAVEMPFNIEVEGTTQATSDVLTKMQRSIRPIHVTAMTIAGNDVSLITNVDAKTYYQPEKVLTIEKKMVAR